MSRERSSDEANPQKEGEFDNPISDTFEDEAAESPSKASMDQKTADLDHDLTDDELSDLTFAFQAMDGDNSGTIELPELLAMMSVLGAEVSDADVKELFQSCKVEFMTWMNSHDQDAALPEYMKHTTGEAGQHGETKHGGARHNVDLAIDRSNKQHPVFSRMKKVGRNPVLAYTVGAPITATNKLLSVSYNLAKDTTAQVATGLLGGSEEEIAAEKAALRELLVSDTHLIFAEYVHMLASSDLMVKHCPGDWHKKCGQMREYKGAFDTVDVDGDNSLEFEEFEMVCIAMDPHHDLTHEDMLYLWKVMVTQGNPQTAALDVEQQSMDFNGFLHGMTAVQKDDICSGWLDVNKPNKWELLSLIIDTPISKAETKEILANMDAIEKFGISMIKHEKPQKKSEMREILNRAGEGNLRKLSPEQVGKMSQIKRNATILSGMVGFVFTLIPCGAEMFLNKELMVDGVKDRFDQCQVYSQINWDVNYTAMETPYMEYPLPDAVDNWMFLKCSVRPVNASIVYYETDEFLEEYHHIPLYEGIQSTMGPGKDPTKVYYDSFKTQTYDDWYDKKLYSPENFKFNAVCLPGAKTATTDRNGVVSVRTQHEPLWSDEQLDEYGRNDDKMRCSKCECEICGCVHHVDGKLGGERGASNPILEFWIVMGLMIGINVVFEILLLMYVAVQFCVKVAWALDQRLVPLNSDRAFVADSLVRAAFELGNPDSPVLGVDPHTESSGTLKVLIMVALYKLKVILTGTVLKTIFGAMTPVGLNTYWKPWVGTCGGTVIWDALVSSCIILQAQIRGFGVFVNAELFNEVMEHHFADPDNISDEGKVEIARGVGVAIVMNGSMYPTMELLLRHSIQYLKLKGKACVSEPGHLDNWKEFIAVMAPGGKLSDEERLVAMSIHLLACILDGDMGHSQMDHWEEVCTAAGDLAGFYPDRITYLTTRFREFDYISAEDLHACFNKEVEGNDGGGAAKCKYCCFQFQNFLTC